MTEPRTILVVDDDDVLRDRLARAFVRRGYLALTAASAEEALDLVAEQPPDLAVFDLKMPGRNGLQLVQEALELAPRLRVVVLTGYSSIATATEAMRLGAVAYLAKPADANDILAALAQDPRREAPADLDDLQPPTLARLEWEHIQRVLLECDGNVSTAARQLGMHRRTLQRKLAKLAPG